DVAAGIRLDANLIARRNEERHLNNQPRLNGGGLGASGSGIALESRLGVSYFQINRWRQVNAERLVVVGHNLDLHTVEQIVLGVAKLLARQWYRLEGLVVHEIVRITVIVRVLYRPVFEECPLETLARVIGALEVRAGPQVAQL